MGNFSPPPPPTRFSIYASDQYINIISVNQKLRNNHEIKKELREISGLIKCLEFFKHFLQRVQIKKKNITG